MFLELNINWDCTNITVDVSMPEYVEASLQKFHHPIPLKPQDVPHRWNRPTYGPATQYAEPEDNLALLPPEGITMVSKIVGRILYYTLAVDSRMLVTLSNLTATQSKTT